MKFGRRQAKGIVGIVLAVLGGIAWYYGSQIAELRIIAFVLWGGAVLIILSLNKRKNQNRK